MYVGDNFSQLWVHSERNRRLDISLFIYCDTTKGSSPFPPLSQSISSKQTLWQHHLYKHFQFRRERIWIIIVGSFKDHGLWHQKSVCICAYARNKICRFLFVLKIRKLKIPRVMNYCRKHRMHGTFLELCLL